VMKGEGQVITGWKNKMQVAMAHVMPAGARVRYAALLADDVIVRLNLENLRLQRRSRTSLVTVAPGLAPAFAN
jgi:hypothetical protein